MHHLIYQSSASLPFAEQQLRLLLAKARAYNQAHDITGVLLYHDGQFVQVLEGEAAAVGALYERIRRAPRHTSVVKLADAPVAARSFGDWSMAFRPMGAAGLASLSGYRDPDGLLAPGETVDSPLAQIIHLTFDLNAEPW